MYSRITGDKVFPWHRKMNNTDERARMPIHSLPISEIIRDTALQPRAVLDSSVIQEYSERISAGDKFPPVDVWDTPDGMLLSSGFHRVAAYESAGSKKVECEVHQGTRRDALLHAIGENKTHGNRRTNADKRRAVEMVLRDEEWVKWSNRKIAEHVGVHHDLVASVRSSCQVAESATSTRIGADGKSYQATQPSKHGIIAAGGGLIEPALDPNEYFDSDDDMVDDVMEYPPEESETDTDIEDDPPEVPTTSAKPSPAKEEPLKDGLGRLVPKKLVPLFEKADKLRVWINSINSLSRELKDEANADILAHIHVKTTLADMANVKRALKFGVPYTECCYCKGKGTCSACKCQRWITEAIYDRATMEMKEWLQ